MIITIDGPSASGKSSAAKLLAQKLGIYYLQTGLLYRAVAYLIMELHKIEIKDLSSIENIDLSLISNISYSYVNGSPCVFYKGNNITDYLSDNYLEQPASIISASAAIRNSLLELQRDIAKKYSIVADGRDCGSVVFPNADIKFYLTADVVVRAKRMQQDISRKNQHFSLEEIVEQMQKRDERDMNRAVAPLRIPKGGIIIDNSTMTIQQTVQELIKHIKDNNLLH